MVSLDVIFKDLDCLKKAVAKIGGAFKEGQKTHKWYGKWVNDYSAGDAAYKMGIKPEDYGKCEHAIGLAPDAKSSATAYEAGVVKRPDGNGWTLIYDFWGSDGRALQELVGESGKKLKQEYGVEVAKKQAKKQGWRVVEKRVDGKVKLICSR